MNEDSLVVFLLLHRIGTNRTRPLEVLEFQVPLLFVTKKLKSHVENVYFEKNLSFIVKMYIGLPYQYKERRIPKRPLF